MIPVGIMHGRLSPPFEGRFQAFPVGSWRQEFQHARAAGLRCIEWIYEVPSADRNPLGSDSGLADMRRLSAETGVGVWSVCADYYMEARLVADGAPVAANIGHLEWLIQRAAAMGIRYIILPFVDQSSLGGMADREALHRALTGLLPRAEAAGVELHLETDLNPAEFRKLLERENHPYLKANFDIGNSASLGFDPVAELEAIGPWLGSVHIKDRVRGGGTVTLGTGAADFKACFRQFRRLGFDRWFILQAARGDDSGEVEWAVRNRRFVHDHWLAAEDAMEA